MNKNTSNAFTELMHEDHKKPPVAFLYLKWVFGSIWGLYTIWQAEIVGYNVIREYYKYARSAAVIPALMLVLSLLCAMAFIFTNKNNTAGIYNIIAGAMTLTNMLLFMDTDNNNIFMIYTLIGWDLCIIVMILFWIYSLVTSKMSASAKCISIILMVLCIVITIITLIYGCNTTVHIITIET